MHDKGHDALVEVQTQLRSREDADRLVAVGTSTVHIRGAGSFGGDRGEQPGRRTRPNQPPAFSLGELTSRTQGLLYRLNGDRNPLHCDPEFARAAGFDRPILHGLCSLGFATRALVRTSCNGDPGNFGALMFDSGAFAIQGTTSLQKFGPSRTASPAFA